jgi:hypothetical protein
MSAFHSSGIAAYLFHGQETPIGRFYESPCKPHPAYEIEKAVQRGKIPPGDPAPGGKAAQAVSFIFKKLQGARPLDRLEV